MWQMLRGPEPHARITPWGPIKGHATAVSFAGGYGQWVFFFSTFYCYVVNAAINLWPRRALGVLKFVLLQKQIYLYIKVLLFLLNFCFSIIIRLE